MVAALQWAQPPDETLDDAMWKILKTSEGDHDWACDYSCKSCDACYCCYCSDPHCVGENAETGCPDSIKAQCAGCYCPSQQCQAIHACSGTFAPTAAPTLQPSPAPLQIINSPSAAPTLTKLAEAEKDLVAVGGSGGISW